MSAVAADLTKSRHVKNDVVLSKEGANKSLI